MKYLFEKLRLVTLGIMALSFFVAVSLSSCGTATTESDDADTTEAVEESTEAADEHPAGEHPSGDDEHPTDSTATEGEEH